MMIENKNLTDSSENGANYDVLVIGGGIAGEEASLNLANMGYQVLLVEKDLSLGGKMIHLSKVFPTLDCSACITTPKVSETMRHPNIKVLTNSVVENIEKNGNGNFSAKVIKKPRYVIEENCTGCQECEDKCPVVVEDQYQYDLVGRKAVYVPFSIASPRIVAIDIENCILCGLCEKVCPADAIDFTQEIEEIPIAIKSVIMATGFNLFEPEVITRYGYGKFKNVVTSMQME
ncbi:MAG: CoB--CoM heterodisulfide reductase iron-sulfur subunit A family protein, partial [Bacteroidales bacterium]|nr:CoB--CoM heterodisulfide reductase iron-sulfur subunit A family protein [Bacteroidales bacterium]